MATAITAFFQIKDMNHVVPKHRLLLLELVSFVQMTTTTSAAKHQDPMPTIIVAGASFTMLKFKRPVLDKLLLHL